MSQVLGYQARFHLCGDAAARARCPSLVGGGATDCHCLPTEAEISALVARPCFGPMDDPDCFFAGVNRLHLAAHYLTGLAEFGFAFDTTGVPIFMPLHLHAATPTA